MDASFANILQDDCVPDSTGEVEADGPGGKQPVRPRAAISGIIIRTGWNPSAASLAEDPEALLRPRQQWESSALNRDGPTGSTQEQELITTDLKFAPVGSRIILWGQREVWSIFCVIVFRYTA